MADGVGVGFGDSMEGVSSDMTAAMGGAGELTAAEAVRAVNDGILANIEGLSGAINAIVERVITGLTAQAQRLNQAGQDFTTRCFRYGNGDPADYRKNTADHAKHYYRIHSAKSKVYSSGRYD